MTIPRNLSFLADGASSTGVLNAASGGTGATTLTGYVIGNGTSAMTASTTIPNSATTANTANSASTIVLRDASGNFGANTISAAFSGDGSAINAINASNISSGTIANARTTAATANGASTIVLRDSSGSFGAGDITAVSISGNGVALTAINASNIASGTIANARTTAATANGASTIVLRGASGEFAAGTITGTFTGNLTGNASGSAATFTSTSQNSQFNSVGVGTAGSGTAGEIRATNNVTAFYSDERLKTKVGNIENALDKVKQIETMVYHANDIAVALGYDASIQEVGVTAQSVQKVMPQVVAPAPIDDKYLTVRYEKLVPLLIEAIKELEAQVAELKAR